MATTRRFSYSLLISTLAFAVFAVFAFSGLFPWIEAQFYSPKVVSDLQAKLGQASSAMTEWQEQSLGRLDKLLEDESFDGVFSPTSSQERLQKRYQSAKLFLLGIKGGGSLRILNADRSEVHFSSEDSDVKTRTDFSLTYRPVAETALPPLSATTLADGKAHILADPDRKLVYFLRPWSDSQATQSGYALLGASIEDLRLALAESGAPGAQQLTALGDRQYLLSLLGQKLDSEVVSRIQDLQSRGVLPPVQRLARTGDLSLALIHGTDFNLVVPASTLELNEVLKYLLLASFYTVLFLLSFLLANLRGEPLSIVTRKVKRFQLQVVRQYLDLKETDKIQSLKDELARHSDEIRSDVRRSLGRVRKRDQEWVDRYIDTSWQEVLDLLRGPSPPVESASNADWKRLETLLQQALTQGRFVVSGAPAAAGVPKSKPTHPAAPADEVEELVEELDDVEELDAVEEADAVEDLEEVEELDEVEELEGEDAEAVEDLEEVGAEELEELAEEAEEAEAVEELEPGDDGEELEELEEMEELDEGDAQDSGTEGSLEELPERSAAPDFSRLRRSPSDGASVTLLSSTEDGLAEPEDLEELEEVLEEFEEEEGGEDASFPLERLDTAWGAQAAGVFEESGDVVTLSEDVFAEAGGGSDPFGSLVDQVLAGPDNTFEPLEEDLVPRHHSRDWRWTGAGFDWDRFALGDDEVNLFRALSEIVTQFDAFTAAILTEADGVWKAQSSVGFSDSGKESLTYTEASPLAKGFLSVRALHVLKGGGSHPVLRESFHAKDMKFLKSVLCVPLLFRHEPAWLLLGMRHEPGDLIELLAPRRVD